MAGNVIAWGRGYEPKHYEGNDFDSLYHWMKQFTSKCQQSGQTARDMVRTVPQIMNYTANNNWYNTLPLAVRTPLAPPIAGPDPWGVLDGVNGTAWYTFMEQMLRKAASGAADTQLSRELVSLRQNEGESVSNYNSRFNTLMDKLITLNSPLRPAVNSQKPLYMNGLLLHIHRIVVARDVAANTLADVMQLALEAESSIVAHGEHHHPHALSTSASSYIPTYTPATLPVSAPNSTVYIDAANPIAMAGNMANDRLLHLPHGTGCTNKYCAQCNMWLDTIRKRLRSRSPTCSPPPILPSISPSPISSSTNKRQKEGEPQNISDVATQLIEAVKEMTQQNYGQQNYGNYNQNRGGGSNRGNNRGGRGGGQYARRTGGSNVVCGYCNRPNHAAVDCWVNPQSSQYNKVKADYYLANRNNNHNNNTNNTNQDNNNPNKGFNNPNNRGNSNNPGRSPYGHNLGAIHAEGRQR